MTRVWVIEIRCSQNHCLAMNAFEAENLNDAEELGHAMSDEYAEMIEEERALDYCQLCREDASEFRVHVWPTNYTDLDEAEPMIHKLHQTLLAKQQKLYTSRN